MNRISKASDRGKLVRASATKNTNVVQPKVSRMNRISEASEPGVKDSRATNPYREQDKHSQQSSWKEV